MAVIVYECDTCNRKIELPQNLKGLEVMSRCIITQNCKGKLFKVGKKDSKNGTSLPYPDPIYLTDWSPRKIFLKFEQTTKSKLWKVIHNLGTIPSVEVHIFDSAGTLIETTDYVVINNNTTSTEISFRDPITGIVQLYSRSPSNVTKTLTNSLTNEEMSQIVVNGVGILSIATPLEKQLELWFGIISPITNNVVKYGMIDIHPDTTSPSSAWFSTSGNISKVFFNNRLWHVRTCEIGDYLIDSITSENLQYGLVFLATRKTFNVLSIDYDNNAITVSGTILDSTFYDRTILFHSNNQTLNSTIESIVNLNNGTTTFYVSSQIPITMANGTITIEQPLDDCNILLSNTPFTFTDRTTNKLLNTKKLSFSSISKYDIILNTGDMKISEQKISSVFPEIISIN